MPLLMDVLSGRDLGFLKMVAQAWGIELHGDDRAAVLNQVIEGILQHEWRDEVLETLPERARQALQLLAQNGGRLSWAVFTRRFGEVRPFGPGKREKERPDLNPISPAEVLWYRAMIGRAFLQQPGEREPVEFAYIPDDLLDVLHPLTQPDEHPFGRPASPGEVEQPVVVNDDLLDDLCTYLAGLRAGIAEEELKKHLLRPMNTPFWQALLRSAGLLDPQGQPVAEPVRAFLEAPRGEALALLVSAWKSSESFNELRLMPGLICEGDWQNDALRARQKVLERLQSLPVGSWWSLAAFVRAFREEDPDFQRPAGDYDSWFIRRASDDVYLRGIALWDEVDGALIRFMLVEILYPLGVVDLAKHAHEDVVSAFRLSGWAESLLQGSAPQGLPAETGKLKVFSSGVMIAERTLSRAVRYQVARFCEWDELTQGEYRYRVTARSLERAAAQGLRPRMLVALLRKQVEKTVLPPSLIQGLERWESAGTQASFQHATLLRVASPEVLNALKRSRAARFLGEELSPTVVLVRRGAEDKVREALAELGYFSALADDEQAP
ncbi:helicase-associated domain-containing protein [Anaerolinea sp.]|uniref:helicase-associated domain-containing protein n=1 Tax=Anaerolinea sp. TaxID=1872519 RepID=UPI002ACE75C4|nr:helicase-associated domain-containing protein [Anaerolinea sp.]